MTSRRPKPMIFSTPKGNVIITLTNDLNWAMEVFDYMPDTYVARVAKELQFEIPEDGEWDEHELFDVMQDDAFDGGRTQQGFYFFVVTVESDGREDDVFVCSSLPLAQTIKDEEMEKLK